MEFPKIEFSSAPKKADALVLPWFQDVAEPKGEKHKEKDKAGAKAKDGGDSLRLHYAGKRDKAIDALGELLLQSKHFRAKKNETDVLRFYAMGEYPNVVLLGLGAEKTFDPEIARQAGAALSLAQKRARLSHVAVAADALFVKSGAKNIEYVQAFCEGYWMAGHEFTELKKKETESFVPAGLTLHGFKGAGGEEAARRARIVANAVSLARLFGDRPANYMTPTIFAKESQRVAKEVGMRCTVLGRNEMEEEKMGLLLGVAKGSHEEPKFVIFEYHGGKKADRPVALVGKGVTFDSGGISLKPASQMEDMKYDMMGAATVVGVCQAVAALKLPINLVGLVAATENMPGGSAQKPGDVARSLSGKTVEITNTDAEGRLILADTLEYAQKYYNPQAIIDFATLTGAVVVALGSVCSGLMGNSRELVERIKEASHATGERVWELPLYEEYLEDLKSHYADIKNSGVRDAGSSKGGVFLNFFVDGKYPWAHCDIAGSAYHRKDVNYHPAKYASGVMVRLMVHLLERWKPMA